MKEQDWIIEHCDSSATTCVCNWFPLDPVYVICKHEEFLRCLFGFTNLLNMGTQVDSKPISSQFNDSKHETHMESVFLNTQHLFSFTSPQAQLKLDPASSQNAGLSFCGKFKNMGTEVQFLDYFSQTNHSVIENQA